MQFFRKLLSAPAVAGTVILAVFFGSGDT